VARGTKQCAPQYRDWPDKKDSGLEVIMLEWLKTILGDAYTDDIDKKVSDEIGKGFVSRADFNAANEAKKTLEGQIAERDKQIKSFEKLAGDNEQLKTQLSQAQEANKTAKAELTVN